MKKRWLLLFVCVFALAILLCACDGFGGGGGNNTPGGTQPVDTPPDGGIWKEIDVPSPYDIYKEFLNGFTGVANEFTTSKLTAKNPKVSLSSKLKLLVNDNDFWATLSLNYDHNDKSNAQLAFQLMPDEDGYKDIIIGIFLFKEKLYVALGQTKFSCSFPITLWTKYFPLNIKMPDVSNLAMGLSMAICNKTEPKGRQKMDGLVKHVNYILDIDLPKSIQNLIGLLNDDKVPSSETYEKMALIMNNVFGLTKDDIENGTLPVDTCKLDFTVADSKILDFNLGLKTKDINTSGTLFEGQNDIDVSLNLKELTQSKSPTAIPFVRDSFADERENYVHYINNAFRVRLDTDKQIDANTISEYTAVVTAKIFQDDAADNYFFFEYIDRNTSVIERALYVYHNVVYVYEGDICKVSFPLDLTDIATRIVANNFGGEAVAFDWLTAISFCVDAIRIKGEDITIKYTDSFYSTVWINMYAMLDYIDSLFEEDIYENSDALALLNFCIHTPSLIKISMEEPFVTLVPDTDSGLNSIIKKVKDASPEVTYPTLDEDELDS